ncbi:MAG TPA: sulfotransferase [Candidatus Limnocylindrales bacterium]|nr:sulfotransferase [Candidatus Limnocylindrales bacterium]
MKLKRPSLVSQGSVFRMIQTADEAWKRRDFQKCFEWLERASRLDPANSSILFILGQRYGLRYDYAAAERNFDKAVQLATKKSEALATAGQLSTDFASHQLSERYFQQALKQKDASPESFARLAELYERLHRLEDASKLVDQALQLDANCVLARLTQARLSRQAGLLEEAEKILLPVLGSAQSEMRIRGHYELGAILDRQGRYDDAMTAFLEAKAALRAKTQPLLAQAKANRISRKKVLADFTAETMHRWFDFGPQLQPARRVAFLGGHPRSGTTLLEQVLDSHPDIVSAEETQVFVDDALNPLRANLSGGSPLAYLEAAQADALQQSRARYFHAMELCLNKPIGDRLLIDKNPSVTLFLAAFIRIFPEIKILIALRDPRDVALSCFMQCYVPVTPSSVTYLSLEETTEGYAHTAEEWKILSSAIKNPRLEVRYEDVVADLESVSRRVLDFLGVPWGASVLRFDEHARSKRVRSPTYADVTQPVFKRALGRWRNYQKYLEPCLDRLEPFVKALGYE